MGPNPAIFRAYDIRGIVGRDLTVEVAHAIGQAVGTLYPGQPQVALGRDGRDSSPALAEALGAGLRSVGRTVIDIGLVPTPLLYFATHALRTGAGIMVTGSHNPPDYNGIKLLMAGHTLHGREIQRILARIRADRFPTGSGATRRMDLGQRYLDALTARIRLSRPLRIGVDYGNGAAGPLGGRLFRALGCEAAELYGEVDGRFPHHHPNPSDPHNLRDLTREGVAQGLELGLAFDGDGDRLGVVDDQGRILWPDRLMMLFSRDVLATHPGALILYDVKSTRHLGEWIGRHGGRPLMWKTGHSLLKAKMRESGALLAGELSGHICFADRWYGFDDALYSAARLLEILSRDPRPSSQVFAGLPDGVATPELAIPLEDEQAVAAFMAAFLARRGDIPGRQTLIDGLRVDHPHGWWLVRASNTTPSLTLRLEGDTEQDLAALEEELRRQIHTIRPDLVLPF